MAGDAATDRAEADFFTDESLVADPYPFFDALRDQCPVRREPHHGVVAVTGYDEALAVYRDHVTFSSCNSVTGPFPGLPFAPEGDDIGAQIAQHRHQLPLSEHFVTMDAPEHTAHRGLLMRLLTPKRLMENEAFMWRLADRQLDEFIAQGSCELVSEYARPFALLVIADLLGVPEEEHDTFRAMLGAQRPGALGGPEQTLSHNPLEFLEERFTSYVEERRRAPRTDVLTGLATATFPDGSTPDARDVARVASFLFAAGQDTTARLLAAAFEMLAENAGLQQQLRDDRARIPDLVEEALRMEGPVKSDFRLARVSTTIGGVDIPAGTTVMILNGAANRDPRRFDAPHEFRLDRRNSRDHLAFGRGIHACPGGPLARIESRVSIERFLDRMADIRISDAAHGPAGSRRYEYEPTYILRGLRALHLEFTPATSPGRASEQGDDRR